MNILFDADSMIYASCYDTEIKDFYSDVDQAIEKYEDQMDELRHEIEDFTYPYSSPLFNYPFKNQKNNINHYEFDHDTETLF